MLRAEKGYPIIGQDTDGTVTPAGPRHGVGGVEEEARLRRQAVLRPGGQPDPLRKQLVGLLPVGPRGPCCPRARRSSSSARRPAAATAGADARPRHLELPQRRARTGRSPWPWSRAGRSRIGEHRPRPRAAAPSSRSRSPARCSSTRKEPVVMAESLTRAPTRSRRGPTRSTGLPDGASPITAEPFVAMVDVRLGARRSAAARGARTLGRPCPTPGCPPADGRAVWLGPDEWLLTSTASAPEELEAGSAMPSSRSAGRPWTSPRSGSRCG